MVRQAIIIILLLFLFTHSYAAEIKYSRSIELPPIRISFTDLQKILDKSASLMATANSKENSQLRREKLSLYKGKQQVTLTGHTLNVEGARLPDRIDRLEYFAYVEEPAAVRQIQMIFSDYLRHLMVEGSSPDQVDALFSTLKDDLISASSVLGGSFQKSFIFTFLFVVLILNIIRTVIYWMESKKRPALPPLAFSVICLIIILVLPVREIFAGFSAVIGDASFMVRHGPVISFLSLVVTLAGIPISYWISKAKTGEGN